MNPTIIIPAYSRYNSLRRLLNSLEEATYPDNKINLIISIDGGASKEVIHVANNFMFSHGQVEMIEREENLGLRKHIVWCGDQTERYGSVIVLEDDLVVDPFFYFYAKEALTFYKDKKKVAGIALYSPEHFDYVSLPFIPVYNGTSGYFMQVACSWGQAWTAGQWGNFRKWYDKTDEESVRELIELPENIRMWPESSWKKYFMAYLVRQNKFFFYPFQSYTTNCSDAGGHHIDQVTDTIQVNLGYPSREMEIFTFPDFDKEQVYYDAYMEPFGPYIQEQLEPEYRDCAIDFYASKPEKILQKKTYCITSRRSRKPLKKIPLRFRPILKNLEFMNEEITNGYLSITRTKDIIFKKEDDVYFMLATYFSRIALKNNKFLEPYIRHVYQEKKKKKISNWLQKKVSFPFRLLQKLFNK